MPPRARPILAEKHYAAPSVFDVANLMREARRLFDAGLELLPARLP
jgi:hypothetical protein